MAKRGEGRMLESGELAEAVIGALTAKQLAGKKIVMTAGPTFEPIDPVRGITNLSLWANGFCDGPRFCSGRR